MDSLGVKTALLSVSTPGVHLGDDAEARIKAREVNEFAPRWWAGIQCASLFRHTRTLGCRRLDRRSSLCVRWAALTWIYNLYRRFAMSYTISHSLKSVLAFCTAIVLAGCVSPTMPQPVPIAVSQPTYTQTSPGQIATLLRKTVSSRAARWPFGSAVMVASMVCARLRITDNAKNGLCFAGMSGRWYQNHWLYHSGSSVLRYHRRHVSDHGQQQYGPGTGNLHFQEWSNVRCVGLLQRKMWSQYCGEQSLYGDPFAYCAAVGLVTHRMSDTLGPRCRIPLFKA